MVRDEIIQHLVKNRGFRGTLDVSLLYKDDTDTFFYVSDNQRRLLGQKGRNFNSAVTVKTISFDELVTDQQSTAIQKLDRFVNMVLAHKGLQ